ncbi:MAG TPA: ATPase P [Desulfobacteraceae bacterium]|nr:ATPase P [Desulfobacteraceae bacterium]
MIEVDIPDFGFLRLTHLVLDYNGTLAFDGRLIRGVADKLDSLAEHLDIHIITADTFGSARRAFTSSPCTVHVLPPGSEAEGKAVYVRRLGCPSSVCIGNGRNDHLMLREAALGIAVLQQEGAASQALLAADIVIPDIIAALGLLLRPRRLAATLRS